MLDKLNVLQLGWQTGFATANQTATRKLSRVSAFSLTPDLQTRALEELRGSLAPTHQTALDWYASSATFEMPDATFEEIVYPLEMLFGTVSPTGAGPYVRAYAAPLTTAVTPRFATLQYGQGTDVYQMQDASVATLTLTGDSNGGLQVGGSLVGGKVIGGNIAELSDAASETRMTGCMAKVLIDAWDATSISTEISNTAFSWELTINSNREYRSYLGSCTPTAYADNNWNGQLKLSMEFNATSKAMVDAILAASNTILEKQIKIVYSVGATTTLRTFSVEFAGHTMQAPQLFTSRNGVTSVDLVFDGVYNSKLANWLKVNSTSGLTTA